MPLPPDSVPSPQPPADLATELANAAAAADALNRRKANAAKQYTMSETTNGPGLRIVFEHVGAGPAPTALFEIRGSGHAGLLIAAVGEDLSDGSSIDHYEIPCDGVLRSSPNSLAVPIVAGGVPITLGVTPIGTIVDEISITVAVVAVDAASDVHIERLI